MEIQFAPSAERFLDTQTNDVRRELFDFADSPESNARSTGSYLMAPVTVDLAYSATHWMIYYQSQGRRMIANIGSINEEPHIWRK